ncbi:MAG: helix-turn-helix domain-containing protein [Gemmatimonadaceae bacterium]
MSANETEDEYLVRLGKEIRKFRKLKRLTLRDLQEQKVVAMAHLSLIERGKKNPSFKVLLRIAKALNVDVRALIPPPKSESFGN